MHLIIYTSEYTGKPEDIGDVLADITGRSKDNNSKSDITGMLFYHNGRFIQALEGETEALEELMAVLENDARHENIQRIVDQAIKKRAFDEWSMGSLDLSEDVSIDPDELIRIRDAYKKHLLVDSKLMVELYKAMLAMGARDADAS